MIIKRENITESLINLFLVIVVKKRVKTVSDLRSHKRGKYISFNGSQIPKVDGLEDSEVTRVEFAFTSNYGGKA